MQIEHAVEELQGLYGPFTMHEKIVQKIWLHGDFDAARAWLVDGRRLEIVQLGKWNLLGGPDFVGAHVRIDGRDVRGDIEVHFRTRDWAAHGHAGNPAYANVVLHVVLFPPDFPECAARGHDDAPLPTLVLLPLLHRDLEEYAADDALETLTARDDWRRFADLAARPLADVESELRERAAGRWASKVASMRSRIARLGFAEAAHHTALEILGYRRNRIPMLNAAIRHPLVEWERGSIGGAIFNELMPQWHRHGIRPANQPRTRLQQYEKWVSSVDSWPGALMRWAAAIDIGDVRERETAAFRRSHELKRIAAAASEVVTANAVGGSRFHTLVCDGFLPLGSALTGRSFADLWFHWFPGDVPENLSRAMVRLGIAGVPGRPQCHGYAQGLLAWLIDRETVAEPRTLDGGTTDIRATYPDAPGLHGSEGGVGLDNTS